MAVAGTKYEHLPEDDVWELPKKEKARRRNITKDGTLRDDVVTGHDGASWADENGVVRKMDKAEENLLKAIKYMGVFFVFLVRTLYLLLLYRYDQPRRTRTQPPVNFYLRQYSSLPHFQIIVVYHINEYTASMEEYDRDDLGHAVPFKG